MPLHLVPHPTVTEPYIELHARSAYSLLDGACLPEVLVQRAADLGLKGLAILDRDDLGGAVRFQRAADAAQLQPVHGATLTLSDGSVLPVLVQSREGWSHLCQHISAARLNTPRGYPCHDLEALRGKVSGLFALTGGLDGPIARALAQDDEPKATWRLSQLISIFGREGLAVEVWRHGLPKEHQIADALIELATQHRLMWLPTGDVRYAVAEDRVVQDVLTCLRHHTTLDEAGSLLLPNDAWHLRSANAMARLWRDHPGALSRTVEVARQCTFGLNNLCPTLPSFRGPDRHEGEGDDEILRRLVMQGAEVRYGAGLGAGHHGQIEHELSIIAQLGLAGYFLIVHDIVRFARRRQILVQGRGSAANSAVCYCLGITAVDPVGMGLLFERFLSESRTDPPDIDLDIAHQRREEVLQYVYERYGRRHAAMVCTTVTWRGKSAVIDIARVLGLKPEVAHKLSAQVGRCEAKEAAVRLEAGGLSAAGLDPNAPRTQALIAVMKRLDRMPRHRSIHTGGFVLTDEPLSHVVPIEPASMQGRTVIQWDKDDLGPVGLIKIDLLGLGILTVLDETIRHVLNTRGVNLDLAHLPQDDPAVFEQISRADTVGLFQIESRAQMQSLPRLQPRRFYDLVVQVAIIRPGPIQGEMVHPYIRRRRGQEPVSYLHPALEPVLERTLGVPLFQEQGMKVAVVMAGFSPSQADRLRKLMGFKRTHALLERSLHDLAEGMRERGVDEDTASRIIKQLQGFASYGFPESHAASFALLSYASAYLRHYFHPEYLVALLNAQPMGFYAASTLLEDARRHQVEVRPVDVLFSSWESSLETDVSPPAVRLGLHLIRGLSKAARQRLESVMSEGRLDSFEALASRMGREGLDDQILLILARAGALRSLWPGRRKALWEVLKQVKQRHCPLNLFDTPRPHPDVVLPTMDDLEETVMDYKMLGLSHAHHPMSFHRQHLRHQGVLSARELQDANPFTTVWVSGIVICRQRPGSAKGMLFITLEDETGMINVVVTPPVLAANRAVFTTEPALSISGPLERRGDVLNVKAVNAIPLTAGDATQLYRSRDFR